MRLFVFAAATVLTGSLFAADPELVSLALPDPQVMAGVNVEQVMLSPFGQFLLAQNSQLPDAGLQKLIGAAGFDPRRDLREILVSFNGPAPGSGPGVGTGSGIVLARGTFDIPKILEAAGAEGGTVETYKGVSIVIVPKQGCFAFPDSTLAIVGDAAGVRAAIDRKSSPTSISSALAVQVNQLSIADDAWFISMVPLGQLQPKAPGAGQDPFAIISKVQQVSGGAKFGANVVTNVQAVAQTDQDAAALAAVLKSLPSIVQMGGSGAEREPAVALLQNLNVTADGPVTKISLSVPEAQIEQMMQANHAKQPQAAIGVDPRSLRASGGAVRDTAATAEQSVPPSGDAAPQRIRVGGDVQKTKLIQQPVPVYPPLAKQALITGVVQLNVIIGKDGTVTNLTVVSGHPLLVPAAVEAVKQWVYEPTLLNGKAVEVVTQIDVTFTLDR